VPDKVEGAAPKTVSPVDGPNDSGSGSGEDLTVIDRIRMLQGVTWEWKDSKYRRDNREREMGLIAQDVQRAFPHAVIETDEGLLMVDYGGLVGVLVEGIKELSDRVDALTAATSDSGEDKHPVREQDH
jgi:hypothetical protein